jgi:hypothetical protein
VLQQGRHSSSLSQGVGDPVGSEGQGNRNSIRVVEEMIRPAIKRKEQRIHTRSQNGQEAICNSGPKGVVNQNTVRAELSLQGSQDRRPPVRPGSKERQHGDAGTTGTEAITNGRNIAADMFTRPEQQRNKPGRAFRGGWTLLFGREDLQLNGSPTNAP